MPDLDTTRTVTIAELADARAITHKAARALVTRRRWTKRTGNDGMLRVDVPVGELEVTEATLEHPKGRPSDRSKDVPSDIPRDVLTNALTALARAEASLEAERGRTDDLRADRDRWADLAVQLRADLKAARALPVRRSFVERLWGRAA